MKYCPMIKDVCRDDCEWYSKDGGCAVGWLYTIGRSLLDIEGSMDVISEGLYDVADRVGKPRRKSYDFG